MEIDCLCVVVHLNNSDKAVLFTQASEFLCLNMHSVRFEFKAGPNDAHVQFVIALASELLFQVRKIISAYVCMCAERCGCSAVWRMCDVSSALTTVEAEREEGGRTNRRREKFPVKSSGGVKGPIRHRL